MKSRQKEALVSKESATGVHRGLQWYAQRCGILRHASKAVYPKTFFLVLHLDLHTPTNKTKCGSRREIRAVAR